MNDTTQPKPNEPAVPKSFRDLLLQGPLTQAQAIDLGIQVADALENRPNGLGKLALEMLSFSDNQITIDPEIAGTPTLLAPEVLQGEASQDGLKAVQLADVWSLGIILYMLLAGHSPFGGITRQQQIKAITEPRPTPDIRNVRPDVSDDLAGLLYHMLQRNVEYRSRVPNVETVRRTLESIQKEYEIPYSIPEFPIVEAKAILKDARQRAQAGKGVLSESEYQLVRRLVDSGELKIGDEYTLLWERSRRQALLRRLAARLIGALVLGLSFPIVGVTTDIIFQRPDTTLNTLLEQAIGSLILVFALNGISIGLITITSHLRKNSKPPWWVLPAVMSTLTGGLLVIFGSLEIATLYKNPLVAFAVGALAGLIIGGVYTISIPRQRQDTIFKQSRRALIISGIIGLGYGVLFLLTQYKAEMTFYTLASSLIAVPALIICLLLSFVLGIEFGDRYIER
jgi:serine/threonine protein kinase